MFLIINRINMRLDNCRQGGAGSSCWQVRLLLQEGPRGSIPPIVFPHYFVGQMLVTSLKGYKMKTFVRLIVSWFKKSIQLRSHPCYYCSDSCMGNDAPNFMTCSRTIDWDNSRFVSRIKRFYYKTWMPFMFNKKRILFLSIAAYISLC